MTPECPARAARSRGRWPASGNGTPAWRLTAGIQIRGGRDGSRRTPEPDLAHGREHRNGVPELVESDLGTHGDGRRVKQIDQAWDSVRPAM